MTVTVEDIHSARARITPHIRRTPTLPFATNFCDARATSRVSKLEACCYGAKLPSVQNRPRITAKEMLVMARRPRLPLGSAR